MKSGVNLDTGDWLENLPPVNLPDVVSLGAVIGELSSEHCQRWGLNTSVKLEVSGATRFQCCFMPLEPVSWESGPPPLVPLWRLREFLKQGLTIPLYHRHRYPDGHWLPGGASQCRWRNFAGA